MKAEMPWWACGVLAIALMNARDVVRPQAPESSFEAAPTSTARRLNFRKKNLTEVDLPEYVNITIPCTLGADPCGVVRLNRTGELKINTIFGERTIGGLEESAPMIQRCKHVFTWTVVTVSLVLLVLYLIYSLINKDRRHKIVDGILSFINGKLDDENIDDFADEFPAERRLKELDPDSPQFIAPGNIYRVLAVMHPGHVGWFKWFNFIFTACTVSYMQLYLPLGIVADLFAEWRCIGVKSPIWFGENGFTFFTQFAALASVLGIFAGMCEVTIRTGCKANYYILSHVEPVRPPMNKREEAEFNSYAPRVTIWTKAAMALSIFSSHPAKSAQDAAYKTLPWGGKIVARSAKMAMETGDITEAVPKPIMPPLFIKINARIWLSISMIMNITMTLILQGVMILKVATYHEKIQDIALVCVSLYFIFDLDHKVMETTPNLRVNYGHAVQKLTFHQFFDPAWMNRLGLTAIWLSRLLTPIGLYIIVLLAWKSKIQPGVFVGGDMFSDFDS